MQVIPRESSSSLFRAWPARPGTTVSIAKLVPASSASLLVLLLAGLSGCGPKATKVTTTQTQKSVVARQPVPTGPPQLAPLPPGGVKAIYLTGWSAGGRKSRAKLIDLVDRTGINAMVIDVKDDGNVTYQVDVPLAQEAVDKMDGGMKQISNIDQVMAALQKHNIFPIARIACFRDKPMGITHPELAVHNRSGGVWKDKKGNAWLNPYKKAAWDYNVDLALDALKHGFKEIQFDYVRFPTDGKMSEMVFPDTPSGSFHEDQIAAFLKYAHDKIHAAGGWFSADVFGLTSMVKNDEGIGQKFVKVVENVDYLCPMVYPSHYAHGEYHIKNPNAEPYKIIHLSVGDAQKRLKTVKTNCKLRPWIQDFTLGPPRYGVVQVTAEMKALSDLGIHEYLLWNAHNRYTEAAFGKPDGTEPKIAGAGATPASGAPTPPANQTTAAASGPTLDAKPAAASSAIPIQNTNKTGSTAAAVPVSVGAPHKQ